MPDTRVDPAERIRTPLLALITQEALERDYQMVAARKADVADATAPDAGARGSRAGRIGVVAVVAAFGGLVALAAAQTHRNADIDNASRSTLIERIESRRAAVQELQGQVTALRQENAATEAALVDLGDEVNATEAVVVDLEVVTGFAAVTGDGVRVELDNAPLADPATEQIRDSDLTLLVDGLWNAGAEAISINGHRLTAQSAIRNSGTAIEVNSTGIAPPYTVLAIGDIDTLSSRFVETESGQAFATLASRYGFSYNLDNVEELRLPAAPVRLRQLRSARELTETEGKPQPEGEGTS